MNRSRSLYLDLMRFLAAMVVLLFHLFSPPFHPVQVYFPAREAVVAFFVISGFVIAYVADTRDNTWHDYAISRLTRLYSVVVPATGLTAVLWFAGRTLVDGVYEDYSHPWARVALTLVFLNQSWNLTVASLNNGPFWSLCYEFWYYAVFGAALFARFPFNFLGVCAAALVAGPRIALLFPTWMIGVLTYRVCKRRSPPSSLAACVAFVMAVMYIIWVAWNGTPLGTLSRALEHELIDGYFLLWDGRVRLFLGGDWRFLDDFYFGVWVAVTLYLVPALERHVVPPQWLERGAKYLASYTFSLYLYHAPLMTFSYAATTGVFGRPVGSGVLLVLVLCTVFALGSVTEHRTNAYRQFFTRIIRR